MRTAPDPYPFHVCGRACSRRPFGAVVRRAEGTLLLLLASLLFVGRGWALEDRSPLAGAFTASPLIEQWNIGQWGQACGPRPVPKTLPGGAVTLREMGGELSIVGPDRTLRSNECWEQMPGLVAGTHSGAKGVWKTRCVTSPTDPRHAVINTTLTASGNSLALDETGEYQFVIEGQNCTASTRRTRTYTPAKAPEALTQPAPATSATPPAPMKPCAEPGEAARLDVRPAYKLLQPGESFSFRTWVADAKGCPVDAHPAWSVSSPDAKVTVTSSGLVTAAPDAVDGRVALAVSLGGRSARVAVEIASAGRYDALLASSRLTDGGESDEVATAYVATSSLGGQAAVAQDTAKVRKLTFVLIIGGLALGLAALGLLLLRRARSAAELSWDSEPPLSSRNPSGDSVVLRCSVCQNEFPSGVSFCPSDGTPLHVAPRRSAPPPAPPPPYPGAPVRRGKICPTCGGRYAAEATFCGEDGTSLVLVN